MLNRFLCFAFTMMLAGCSTGVNFNPAAFFKGNTPKKQCKQYSQLSLADANAKMDLTIYQLQHNIERSLVFREKITANLAKLTQYTDQDKPFSPLLIDKLSQAIKTEIDLMRPILATAVRHGCWIKHEKLKVKNSIKLKGNMIVLATLVSLYDEYGTVFAVISENDRLRRFLNNADSGYDRDEYLLESLTKMFIDSDLLSYTTELIQEYNQGKDVIEQLAQGDDNLAYLINVVEQSKSFPVLLEMDFFDAANYRRKVRRRVTSDTLQNIGRATINGLSEGFSNAVGDYEERKGLLYQDKQVAAALTSQLQIGDILLEKTPFRLTDSMIPGHWGHAAVWIGTEQELKSIGLWQHALVKPYQQQIQAGELIAESLRSGTQLSSLAHFLNVDDVAIVRSKKLLSKAQLRETILLALRQIGKAYDFNFDVETTDKIVCSQLVYLAYSHIQWPTESTLGRYTISPDNIAVKALNDGPFELMVFYHDGKLMKNNPLELMGTLMKNE
ncbi:YiiX/YebB-like N1pC/P60 family cysteine hydrolase [Colwellia psychrerythraea]|nr:YiiX/YebB-like N1pC/P60 family cysteine hydrolase [Colwellia psychrerythraea]